MTIKDLIVRLLDEDMSDEIYILSEDEGPISLEYIVEAENKVCIKPLDELKAKK